MITLTWMGLFYMMIISYFIIKGIICIFSHIVNDSYIVGIETDFNNYTYVIKASSYDKAYINGVVKYCELHSARDIKKVKVTESDY